MHIPCADTICPPSVGHISHSCLLLLLTYSEAIDGNSSLGLIHLEKTHSQLITNCFLSCKNIRRMSLSQTHPLILTEIHAATGAQVIDTLWDNTLEAGLRANCFFTNPNYSFPPHNFSNTVLKQNTRTQTQAYKGFFLFTVTKQQ